MDVTECLARWATSISYEDLPDRVVTATRRSMIDSIGVMTAGSGHPAVATLAAMLEENAQDAPAPGHLVVGDSRRRGILDATLLNGTMAHVLDFDDTILPTRCHISAPLLSALLAASERTGASGDELISAFAVGFEVVTRCADAVYSGNPGWHGTGVMGPLGVAVAVGRLLGLDESQTRHALALGANQSSGLRSSFGSMAKSWNLGRAGANGLHAALLAQRGFTGGTRILDPDTGFLALLSETPDYTLLTKGLGDVWAVERNGFKPYPCGFVAHAAIDGTLQARSEHWVEPEHITAIRIHVAPETMRLTGNRVPATGLEAKFSVFHAVAGAYVDGYVSVDTFSDSRAVDERYRSLAAKVEAIAVPTYRQGEATIEIQGLDGRHSVYVENALGTPANPMTDQQLEEKFTRLTARVLGEGASQVKRVLWSLHRRPASDLLVALDVA